MKIKKLLVNIFGKRVAGIFIYIKFLLRFILRKFFIKRAAPKNILIISLGRSGTTWISNSITEYVNGEDLGEILQFNPPNIKNYLNFCQSVSSRDVNIIKILTYQLEENSISIDSLAEWCDKNIDIVVCVKRNMLEQIASVIYSESVGMWHRTARTNDLQSINISKEKFDKQFIWSKSQLNTFNSLISKINIAKHSIHYESFHKDYLPEFLSSFACKDSINNNPRGLHKRKVKRINKKGISGRVNNWNDLKSWFEDAT